MTLKKAGMAAAMAATIAFTGAPVGTAATSVQPFGTRETIGDPGGVMVTAYTVAGLAPSSDAIPYRPMGRLYEAQLTVEADRGATTPVLPPFLARSASGQSYRALTGVPTALGITPVSLMQGQRNSGKLYFDVTGEVPNSVAYNDGTKDLLLWVGPAVAGAPARAAAPMMPAPPPPPTPMAPASPPAPATPWMPGTPGY